MKEINCRVKVPSRLAFLAACLSVPAQTLVEVRIEGRVTDPYGSPIKAAEVKATLGKGEDLKETTTDVPPPDFLDSFLNYRHAAVSRASRAW
jgi:hypothetical protein